VNKTWLLLRSAEAAAAVNMAIDDALLDQVHAVAKPVLRFYSWSEPASSFGYFQRYAEVSRSTPLRPLVRRPTGGGIVPHDADWTYSLVFPPSHWWYALKATESYRRVHEWVRAAFEDMGVQATLAAKPERHAIGHCFAGAEQFDVLFNDRKIAGAAQRRTRGGLLIQGSVQPPPDEVRAAWEAAMCGQATREWGTVWETWELPDEIKDRAARLAKEKYSTPAYNERR
jgi:lipoyl(octanoyl) transferase